MITIYKIQIILKKIKLEQRNIKKFNLIKFVIKDMMPDIYVDKLIRPTDELKAWEEIRKLIK